MKKLTKAAGVIFVAAMSVYSGQVIAAKPVKSASSIDKSSMTDVRVLEEIDPFAAAQTPESTVQPVADIKAPPAPLQMNPDGSFSLNIAAGADVVEQLRVIGFKAQMSIIPSRDVHGTLPAIDLYDVTVHEALDALLHPNGYEWREKGKFIYVYSMKEIAEMEKANRLTSTAVFRLNYISAADAQAMIKPVLSDDGGRVAMTPPAVAGISSGGGDVGGDSHSGNDVVVVTDYPENLDKVRELLKQIDRRPQQILIEATILSAKLTEDNALGVDFNVVGGVDFTQFTTASGQITNSSLGGGTLGSNTHAIGTGNSFTNDVNGGLRVGVVTDNISIFLAAMEGVTDTTVVANPKILALNKQRGQVLIGDSLGYKTATNTETTQTETVEFLDTGTKLIFRPYIGDDGYIRMEVHPEISTGVLIDGVPSKNTTEVTSNVMVKDGHTIVIGGLFTETNSSVRSQIPGLGNLPVAGPLFRKQKDSTVRTEIIILLTPHIVKDDTAYAKLSAEELANVEKLRVGVRKGMMFWGRSQLAEMNYEWATAEMSKARPNRKKALWHLDAATNLNPKFLEAINLKQDLTGKEITDADNSSIRSFVTRAILEDRAPATQPAAEAAETPAAPTTQQVAEAATAPATQPVAIAPTTQPAQSDADAVIAESMVEPVEPAETAAVEGFGWSDLLGQEQPAPETMVTELPIDEIPAGDDNK